MARIDMSGTTVSLVAAYDYKKLQLFGKVSYLSWEQDVYARFDQPRDGEFSDRQRLSWSGTSIAYGGGMALNFSPGWWLRGEGMYSYMEDDDIFTYSVSMLYDFYLMFEAK